jgi:hypothetical protein
MRLNCSLGEPLHLGRSPEVEAAFSVIGTDGSITLGLGDRIILRNVTALAPGDILFA